MSDMTQREVIDILAELPAYVEKQIKDSAARYDSPEEREFRDGVKEGAFEAKRHITEYLGMHGVWWPGL
jgi:hypothetical protein